MTTQPRISFGYRLAKVVYKGKEEILLIETYAGIDYPLALANITLEPVGGFSLGEDCSVENLPTLVLGMLSSPS